MPTLQDPRKRHLFTCQPRAESFSATSIDEAIGEWLDEMTLEHIAERINGTVTVYEYAPEVPDVERFIGDYGIAYRLLEELDEDTGEDTQPNDAMLAAERAFVETVIANYRCWNHEEVDRHEVDLFSWCLSQRHAYVDAVSLLKRGTDKP